MTDDGLIVLQTGNTQVHAYGTLCVLDLLGGQAHPVEKQRLARRSVSDGILIPISCVAEVRVLTLKDLLALAVFSRCRKVAHNNVSPNALSRFFSLFSPLAPHPMLPSLAPFFEPPIALE